MRTSWYRPENIILPLTLVAFIGLTSELTRPFFNVNTRWAVLLILLVSVLPRRNSITWLNSTFGLVLLVYLFWCFLTYSWSIVPLLSLMKATAFCLVAVTMIAAGYLWSIRNSLANALDYLYPFIIFAMLTGILGKTEQSAIVHSGKVVMYQGLVSGPNMFGMMMAMIIPFILWKLFSDRRLMMRKFIWLLLLALTLVFLILSVSRASMLVVFFTFSGFLITLHLRTRIMIIMSIVLSILFLILVQPAVLDSFQKVIIYKYATPEQGVLFTRQRVWSESYALALQGGWIGAGYGVTIGQENFSGSLTSVAYGREKGNSQLAIVEETGIVGLFLYFLLLLLVYFKLVSVYVRTRDQQCRMLIGIVSGTLMGMVVHSVFEAWWVAPGSPESVYFWSLVGVGIGISSVAKKRHFMFNRIISPEMLPRTVNTV